MPVGALISPSFKVPIGWVKNMCNFIITIYQVWVFGDLVIISELIDERTRLNPSPIESIDNTSFDARDRSMVVAKLPD